MVWLLRWWCTALIVLERHSPGCFLLCPPTVAFDSSFLQVRQLQRSVGLRRTFSSYPTVYTPSELFAIPTFEGRLGSVFFAVDAVLHLHCEEHRYCMRSEE